MIATAIISSMSVNPLRMSFAPRYDDDDPGA
jgi:hypothetical protein